MTQSIQDRNYIVSEVGTVCDAAGLPRDSRVRTLLVDEAKIVDNPRGYAVRIYRADGDISIEFLPVKGKPYQIGAVKGVRVFADINKRHVSIKLNKTPGMAFKNGKFKVKYQSNDTRKRVVYAETEMEIIP